jgi:ABC-type uncharacterized transport system permease subunit
MGIVSIILLKFSFVIYYAFQVKILYPVRDKRKETDTIPIEAIAKTPAKFSAYQILIVIVVFVILLFKV